ncbi:HNH endonuclease [Chroococcidiopsis sp.]|uniref:HNH endonuclease n=1 Tax=Chroococcidiopsis sp. TaxID=3088168 RepID=UPI003F2FE43B
MNSLAFDTEKYFLGKLCKNKHEWENAGQSLRSKGNKHCVACMQMPNAALQKARQDRAKKEAALRDEWNEQLIQNGIDVKVFKLSTLCENNHDWNETGKSLRYRLQGSCVECRKNFLKERYQANKKGHLQRCKLYAQANSELIKEIKARYREKHREELREKNRRYSELNKEQICARAREKIKREDYKVRIKLYSQRPEVKAMRKQYLQTEAGKISQAKGSRNRRARDRQVHRTPYIKKDIKQLREKFNNSCAYCGCSSSGIQIDHWLPLSKGGSDTLSNFLPACKNCNMSKFNAEGKAWYEKQSFYSIKRWRKIEQHLGKLVCKGQLPLF